jgi:aspartate racemase
MKRIGIIGGLSPESTLYYYRLFIDMCNENERLHGAYGVDYPPVIIYSVNFNEFYSLIASERWPELTNRLLEVLQALHRAGADFGLISSNTPHAVFDELKARSPIPLMSIVEEICRAVWEQGLSRVGLFGTGTTMRLDFYQKVFRKRGITIVLPREDEQAYIQSKIISELALGILSDETRTEFLRIGRRMVDDELIEGLLLACTEIPLLLSGEELGVPLFDTARIHVESALKHALTTGRP